MSLQIPRDNLWAILDQHQEEEERVKNNGINIIIMVI